jgi:hypothetical protein
MHIDGERQFDDAYPLEHSFRDIHSKVFIVAFITHNSLLRSILIGVKRGWVIASIAVFHLIGGDLHNAFIEFNDTPREMTEACPECSQCGE